MTPRSSRGIRGSAFTEYAVLVAIVGIGVALAIVAAGLSQTRKFERTRQTLASPYP
jgi:hypothetical protein